MATATKSEVAVELRVVTRGFDGAGEKRVSGEVVNISGWRNSGYLEELRYLRPLAPGITPVEAADGRQFIDDASRKAYEATAKAEKTRRATKPAARRKTPAPVEE